MMTISNDIMIAIGGALMGFLTICCHLLIDINRSVSNLAVGQKLTEKDIETISRHQQKNAAQVEEFQRFINSKGLHP